VGIPLTTARRSLVTVFILAPRYPGRQEGGVGLFALNPNLKSDFLSERG
jgi:hypothetical protein